MLRPSYTDLMNVLNDSNDIDNQVTSRYTIVIAAAKRARQIIDGDVPLGYSNIDKAVSTAVKELYDNKVKVKLRNDFEEPVISDGPKKEQLFITEV